MKLIFRNFAECADEINIFRNCAEGAGDINTFLQLLLNAPMRCIIFRSMPDALVKLIFFTVVPMKLIIFRNFAEGASEINFAKFRRMCR